MEKFSWKRTRSRKEKLGRRKEKKKLSYNLGRAEEIEKGKKLNWAERKKWDRQPPVLASLEKSIEKR